ncbi:MAG: ferritin family protein [Deltaproteobacteria bacterium]|nr:ferritin family protein [Deltaproteobacteria bacterium]
MTTDRLSALETALNNEMREREFYLRHAARTTNPLGRAMFGQLADEELEHHQRLQELHDKWQQEGKWPATVPLTVAGSNLKQTLNRLVAKVEQLPPGDDDDVAAVRQAIAFEAEAAAFYQRLRDASTDEREKAFFDLLAKLENEHLASLKETEEFFLDPARWYQLKEHGGLDGA